MRTRTSARHHQYSPRRARGPARPLQWRRRSAPMPTSHTASPVPRPGPMASVDDAAGVRDPELRATLERMGRLLAAQEDDAPGLPAQATPAPRLPVFPDAARPLVNDMARSALFACVQGKDRRRLDEALLATVAGVEIRFTGRQWNQDDHDLLMRLGHMADQVPPG